MTKYHEQLYDQGESKKIEDTTRKTQLRFQQKQFQSRKMASRQAGGDLE